jgi:2-polyprenyl-3-methyl-5-hydroxy-6-metoxy-1,4-benzoquinol methylase
MGTEQIAEYYDKAFSEDKKYQGNYRDLPHFPVFQIALSHMKEYHCPFVLELGCGTGQFAKYLWDNGVREYMGVDFSEVAVELARKMSPQVFSVGDLMTYSFPSEFNCFVMMEVLEHIEKDLEIIEKIKQDANIIFSVPNFNDPAHVRFFSSKSEVEERYKRLVRIQEILKYRNWYVVKGVRNGTYTSSVSK